MNLETNSNRHISAMTPHSHSYFSAETFYRLVVIAIILRVAIMPLFGHVDLLSEARRIFFWDESGIYFDDISRNATALFQLMFFKVFSIFIENKEVLFGHADMARSTASPSAYFEFVSQPNIFRAIFIIKLPFLAADLITAWAIYQYCDRTAGAKNAVLFWLFNPMTIFAFYIFGRFESIPIMFCMLSLLAMQRQRLILSACLIGLSVNSRELFIFLGPLFLALVCSPSCKQYGLKTRIIAFAIVAIAIAIAVQLISLTGSATDSFGREVTSIASEGRVDYLFAFKIGSFVVFPMVYLFLLLYAWNSHVDLNDKAIVIYALMMISFFCLSSHTAHYTSWMVMFPCVFLAFNNNLLKPMLLLCITWFVFNLSITDLGVFTTWLASPWSINLAGLPNFPQMYQALGLTNVIDMLTFQRLSRTFYGACLIFIGALILRAYLQQINHTEVNHRGES